MSVTRDYLRLRHTTSLIEDFSSPTSQFKQESLGTVSFIYYLHSQFQRFLFQTLCVFSQMKDTKHIRCFLFCRPGHALGVGLGGDLGAKTKFCPAVCPLCYLLLNHWTKINQIWCVSYSHKLCAQRIFFLPRPLGPWGGVRRSNII